MSWVFGDRVTLIVIYQVIVSVGFQNIMKDLKEGHGVSPSAYSSYGDMPLPEAIDALGCTQ